MHKERLVKNIEPKIVSRNIGNAEIQYLLYEGDGPVMIMLHATGFLPWLWHPIARRLCGEYRIIAPYFCDHREAEPEDGGLPWKLLAEDLCGLCKSLELENPYLVGHSMGATIITLAAALYGNSAAGMVLIEPIFLPQQFYGVKISVDQHPLASKSIKRRNHWSDRQEARDYLRSRALFKNWDDEMLDLYLAYGMISGDTGGLNLACHPRKEASLFMGGMHYDPWPLLPKIKNPVMVVEGETSENRAFIDLKKAASLFPSGQYHMVEGAGHLIPMERPEEISALINRFFQGHDGVCGI